MARLCKKCEKTYGDNVNFCESCGSPLVQVAEQNLPDSYESVNNNAIQTQTDEPNKSSKEAPQSQREWIISGPRNTQIVFDGSKMRFVQYNWFNRFTSKGIQTLELDINNITVLEKHTNKSINTFKAGAAVIIAFSAVTRSGVSQFIFFLFFLLLLTQVRKKEHFLIIQHKQGMIKIAGEDDSENTINDFIAFMRRSYPEIKINMM
ncbi:hypothetical protein [uncultured Anaerovibrio sp.]|uniref:hypothetical protein n=1 Tax=uncultured Anaerovibrio sp. TaxID=361586 RepID=UPI0025FE0543|nr:hypothetical protein [uncultured Anaerovibrio sp.]